MSGLPMHRSSAKHVTIVYRAVAIAGAAAAFGVLSFGAPGLNNDPIVAAVPTGATERDGDRAESKPGEQDAFRVSEAQMTAIALRFGMAEPVEDGSVGVPGETVESGGTQDIQFLGSILSSSRRLAMLSLNGTQRVVREGQEINDPGVGRIKLVSVQPQMIQIEHNGSSRRITKQSRSAAVLSVVREIPSSQPAGGFDPQEIKARRERLLQERADRRLEEERPDWRRRQVITDEKNGIRTRSGEGGGTQTAPLTGRKPGVSN